MIKYTYKYLQNAYQSLDSKYNGESNTLNTGNNLRVHGVRITLRIAWWCTWMVRKITLWILWSEKILRETQKYIVIQTNLHVHAIALLCLINTGDANYYKYIHVSMYYSYFLHVQVCIHLYMVKWMFWIKSFTYCTPVKRNNRSSETEGLFHKVQVTLCIQSK